MGETTAESVAAGPGQGLRTGADGLLRCAWPGDDPTYLAYHDDEWGVPVTAEGRMFEMLVLEAFQAGLSWITILRRREAFREAFDGFDPVAIAAYGDDDIGRLLGDSRIIRNRAKILATVANARATLRLHEEGTSLVSVLTAGGAHPQRRAPSRPEDVPATTAEATALAKDLKRRGFRFLGPVVVYAHLQATGVVNDHLVGCAFRDRA